jgi:hypothetical protein
MAGLIILNRDTNILPLNTMAHHDKSSNCFCLVRVKLGVELLHVARQTLAERQSRANAKAVSLNSGVQLLLKSVHFSRNLVPKPAEETPVNFIRFWRPAVGGKIDTRRRKLPKQQNSYLRK